MNNNQRNVSLEILMKVNFD